jgi:MFS family permease
MVDVGGHEVRQSAQAVAPRARFARLVMTSLPISVVATLAGFGVFTFVNNYIVNTLGYSNAQWTAASLWLVGSMALWPFLITEITPRLGRRRTVALALACAALFFAAMAFTTSFPVICGLLIIIGLVLPVNVVAWFPMVAEVGGALPGRAIAIHQFIGALVSVVTLWAGKTLLQGMSYQHAFLLFAGVCMLCAIIFARQARPFDAIAPRRVVGLRQIRREDVRRLLFGPFLVIVLLGLSMEPFNFHTLNQLFPNLARDAHQLSNGAIADVVALGRLPALLSLPIMAWIIDRMRPVQVYGICVLCDAACIIALGLAVGVTPLIFAYLGFYLFHGFVWGSNSASVTAVVPAHLRDAAFALLSVSQLVAVFLVGVFHNRLLTAGMSLPQLFVTCGVIGACAGVGLLLYSLRLPAKG